MNAGQLLLLIADVIGLLEAKGILLPDGRFDATKLDTVQEDVAFAASIETVLEKYGLNVPELVSALIQLLPLIAPLVR